jgi:outer membrane protein OmpA-like peptidoglycan-associated protein
MRATSTLNRLAAMGIDKSRMTAEGHGEDDPVADYATAEGRRQNRRVVIIVTDR